MNKTFIKAKQIFLALGVMLVVGFFIIGGSEVKAQPSGCYIDNVELTPGGNLLSSWYKDNDRDIKIAARLNGCKSTQIKFEVWGRTAFANVPLNSGSFTPSSDYAILDDTFNIGEDGCVSTRVPQCQYFVTFSQGATVLFSSQNKSFTSVPKTVVGFNCDGLCDSTTAVSNLNGLTNLQSTYDIILNKQGSGTVNGAGTFPIGNEPYIQAIPSAGSYFEKWQENGVTVSTDARIKVKLTDKNRTLTAVFAVGTAPAAGPTAVTADRRESDCAIGPALFDPQGNLLFGYSGGTMTVNMEWLATNCYGKELQVTVGVKAIPVPAIVSTQTIKLDDAFFGFSSTNPYDAANDLVRFTAVANLGDGPCDLSLFPACQYFIEIEDVSAVNNVGILYTSRNDPLRTTSKDVVGFHCFGSCDVNSSVSTWTKNVLFKEYSLKINVFTDGVASTAGGIVKGDGVFPINSDVNIEATPNLGYTFDRWDLAGTNVNSPRAFVSMAPQYFTGGSSERTIQAHFTSNTSKTLTVNITGNGSVAGAGSFPAGSRIEVIATPDPGWVFTAWKRSSNASGGTEVFARNPGIFIELDESTTTEAVFEELEELGDTTVVTESLVPCENNCGWNHFVQLIQRVIRFFLILVLPLAAVLAVYIGIMFLTSGGKPAAREKAKKAMGNFIIGIIVILIAWLLVAAIIKILGADNTSGTGYSFLNQ